MKRVLLEIRVCNKHQSHGHRLLSSFFQWKKVSLVLSEKLSTVNCRWQLTSTRVRRNRSL